ncbi:HD domain-containing phosphohydrolase, partial [Endothiovibrio diazotrophicus]
LSMLGFTLLLVAAILWLLRRRFLRPLASTVSGFEKVANGAFGYQVPIERHDELGRMGEAFNQLSGRLFALFRLTGRINEAQSLDETLTFVFDEFRDLLPTDWVGLLTLDQTGERFVLERLYSDGPTTLLEGSRFDADGSLLATAMETREPLHLPDLGDVAATNPHARFAAELERDGRRSALFFPLSTERHTTEHHWGAVLVFASQRPAAYRPDHLELLGNIAGQVSQGFEKTVITEHLVVSAVSGLAKLAESRDPETGDHLMRMSLYSAIVAEEMNREGPHRGRLPAAAVRDILRFAPMHDIGKVGIEDGILLKPGRLTDEERREMERHPGIGGDVLRRCEIQMNAVGRSVFRIGIEIAEGHHEKWSGGGYPNGLAGEAIPLSARIVAAADVFDALTSKRPYKEAWPVEKALELMNEEAGLHFDPEVIAAFNRALPRVMEIYERHKHV